jgi:hypothetical protein
VNIAERRTSHVQSETVFGSAGADEQRKSLVFVHFEGEKGGGRSEYLTFGSLRLIGANASATRRFQEGM